MLEQMKEQKYNREAWNRILPRHLPNSSATKQSQMLPSCDRFHFGDTPACLQTKQWSKTVHSQAQHSKIKALSEQYLELKPNLAVDTSTAMA